MFHLALLRRSSYTDLKYCFQPIFISGAEYVSWALTNSWISWRDLGSKGPAVFQGDSKPLAVEVPETQLPREEAMFVMENLLTWWAGG